MKDDKGFSLIIALIVVLLIGAISGMVYWSAKKINFKKVSEKDINQNNPNCGSSPISSIKILSPNGGEVYESGEQIVIKWESCNIPPLTPIQFLLSGGENESYSFQSFATVDNKSTTITLPFVHISSGQTINKIVPVYKIYIGTVTEDKPFSSFDYSNDLFTIMPVEIKRARQDLNKEISKSIEGKYEVKYPKKWTAALKEENSNYSNFKIKNNPNAILPGANSNMGERDSIISIDVSYGVLPNGVNFSEYNTIDDLINDPKIKLPKTEREARLDRIVSMEIGGHTLRVSKLTNFKGEAYSFVYNGRAYGINLVSGSSYQFKIDYPTFTEIVSSMVFQ